MPITFDADGARVSSIAFSVDYDESCLSFDPTDADSDGIADSVNLIVPEAFGTTWVGHDPEDADGELDTVIADATHPFEAMPNGVIMEIALTVTEEASCSEEEAAVGFSSDPHALYANDEGERLEGDTEDGSIRISTPTPTATAIATATPTFTPTATHTPTATPVPANPSLSIPEEILAMPGQSVTVTITFDSDGAEISGVTFSLDYDRSCLSFDPTDSDSDGLPDSVNIMLPPEFDRTLVAPAPEDADREIDVVLADIRVPAGRDAQWRDPRDRAYGRHRRGMLGSDSERKVLARHTRNILQYRGPRSNRFDARRLDSNLRTNLDAHSYSYSITHSHAYLH